jgi:alkylation response protein AidB-like acyl-CoA dehydrogenase
MFLFDPPQAFQMKAGAPQASLGGPCALVKVASTRTLEFCAREASQIFGGASYVREGKGQKVERIYREVRVNAIGGGSEEVLIDLAMKQARL